MPRVSGVRTALLAMLAIGAGCGDPGASCGPEAGVVARVIDGDTIVLESGETIRYLMVDTPETTSEVECFGADARSFNTDAVGGKAISLRYDVECTDRFDRLLAYVSVDGQEINRLLVERGYGCVLRIAPNGAARADEFEMLEFRARAEGRGLWSACPEPRPC